MIICILPLSWCLNILVSSNYLLKVLEWQAESSLFTIRVRGKQWYWVYKFDFRNFTDIISAPRNVGRNKWTYSFCGEIQTSSNYYHLMQLRSQSKFIKKFWGSNLDNFTEEASSNNIALIENYLRGTNKLNRSKQSKKLNFKFLCANEHYYNKNNVLVEKIENCLSNTKNSGVRIKTRRYTIEARKEARKCETRKLFTKISANTEISKITTYIRSKKYIFKLLNKEKAQLQVRGQKELKKFQINRNTKIRLLSGTSFKKKLLTPQGVERLQHEVKLKGDLETKPLSKVFYKKKSLILQEAKKITT